MVRMIVVAASVASVQLALLAQTSVGLPIGNGCVLESLRGRTR